MGMKERGKRKGCTGSNEKKEKGGELGKELSIGYVSCIVKTHYWQPYRLAPKMSWPPLASPLKKAGTATRVASIPLSYIKSYLKCQLKY